jgi:hypothetical protein
MVGAAATTGVIDTVAISVVATSAVVISTAAVRVAAIRRPIDRRPRRGRPRRFPEVLEGTKRRLGPQGVADSSVPESRWMEPGALDIVVPRDTNLEVRQHAAPGR